MAKGFQQNELAQAIQMDQSVVSQVEADKRQPTADFCIAFAAAIGLSVEYVLAKAGKPGYEQYLNAEGDTAAHGEESAAARKIRALVGMLDSEDQERAIQLLETLVRTRKQSAPVKPARSRAG